MKKCLLLFLILLMTLLPGEAQEEQEKQGESKSALTALALGTVIPGGGDFYAGKPLKGFIYFAIGAFLGYQTYHYWRESDKAYELYERTGGEDDYSRYETAYDRTQQYLYFYLINLAVSVLDGVVEASLSDWSVENVHIEQARTEDGRTVLSLKKEF
ncbi:MAG TPA: hypothetical protein PLL34_04230 [Candidatus Mcinerneyibacteriales bacterium]|nr:hypothetical protein [Candidatus Mcinerneyibacteriales bacterium]